MPRNLESARFYAILDTGYVPVERWTDVCAQLIEGGADLIQIRAKDKTLTEREALLREMLPLFDLEDPTTPRLIINDDADLCARHPGTGLHIGQDDMAPAAARARIDTGRIIGLSTHSAEQARAALNLPPGTIDYFCVGPVFPTRTKPDYIAVGLELVRVVTAMRPELPWFAIGGITRANVAEVARAGATRVVVVSDVLCANDPAAATREVRARLPARGNH